MPHPQRREVVAQHPHGVAGFIRESIEYLACKVPFWSNYFYAVYVLGAYSEACCPEYLKPAQFALFKDGLVDRIEPHTERVTAFLQRGVEPISRFVLLDHMDWMSSYYPEALTEEWEAILKRATPKARIIFRSAHVQPRYLDNIRLGYARERLYELMTFDHSRAHLCRFPHRDTCQLTIMLFQEAQTRWALLRGQRGAGLSADLAAG